MKIYNYSDARQNFSSVLNTALREEVIVRRRDGTQFRITPIIEDNKRSPFDVAGVNTDITKEEILDVVREIREAENN